MNQLVVLDTNVVSAAIRGDWPPAAQEWFAHTRLHQAITVVTVMELTYGIARMPAGRRRTHLAEAIQEWLSSDAFTLLELSTLAAVAAGSMRAAREAAGRPLSVADAQIAGIARTNDACVATRNSRDFVDLDVDVINPWHLR